jgi:hypothetical protein
MFRPLLCAFALSLPVASAFAAAELSEGAG